MPPCANLTTRLWAGSPGACLGGYGMLARASMGSEQLGLALARWIAATMACWPMTSASR